jgi:hypothetical protein
MCSGVSRGWISSTIENAPPIDSAEARMATSMPAYCRRSPAPASTLCPHARVLSAPVRSVLSRHDQLARVISSALASVMLPWRRAVCAARGVFLPSLLARLAQPGFAVRPAELLHREREVRMGMYRQALAGIQQFDE